MLQLDGTPVDLKSFCQASEKATKLNVSDSVRKTIKTARNTVDKLAAGEEPVYGLNTGLGANLDYRIPPEEIPEFQMQLVRGRAVACGDPVSEVVGRAALLARIISAAVGVSGISEELFDHLCRIYEAGLSPVIPEFGSIGAGDLVQNAHLALAILGEGQFWRDGVPQDASSILDAMTLSPPQPQPKDAMVLVNHSSISVAGAALGLYQAGTALDMAKHASVLALEGYGANRQVFGEAENRLRETPGQAASAQWYRNVLQGAEDNPRRIQEALSFRTLAPVMGAAEETVRSAVGICEAELNGSSDSPAVLADGSMHSTTNFHSPALAIGLESVALSMAMVANGCLQRIQKLMDPELSDLPRYLTPAGGGSAGMVPAQKTAASLLGEIRKHAAPVAFDASPVSDAVEDMAPMTGQAAVKLSNQAKALKLLAGLEALVACQALDLRGPENCGKITGKLWPAIRKVSPTLAEDRALGNDINGVSVCLEDWVLKQAAD